MTPEPTRRRLGQFALGAALLPAAARLTPARAQAGIEVVDLAGRTVRIPRTPRRLVLGEGRMIYALALLERPDPFARVVGWKDDLKLYDPDAWAKYRARFPHAERIADLGNPYAGDWSPEAMIALEADLVVLDLGSYFRAVDTKLLDKLERAGIPALFTDWREDPSQNMVPSIQLLGRVLDRRAEAEAFAAFAQGHMRRVYTRVGNLKQSERPLVFMERAAGINPNLCCSTWGPTNFGRFVEEAGGRNWGSKLFAGAGGDVAVERLLTEPPDAWILTGANWSISNPDTTAVLLGYQADPESVQKRLEALMARPGVSSLEPARSRRALALYHQFYNSPYAFVAVEAMAQFLHPRRFEGVDPAATWAELHRRFLPIEPSGVFWAALERRT